MGLLYDRVQMTTATTGTGTITLGSAVAGYQSFATAGVPTGTTVRYVIQDGNNWEIGTGTYTSSGTTLSRTVMSSSNSGSAISLSGSAVVFISMTAEDIVVQSDDPLNSSGLGAPAIINGTVYAHKAAGVTMGSGQSQSVQSATATGLQNAINYASSNGKFFEIIPGVYEIYSSTGLSIPGGNGFVWRGSMGGPSGSGSYGGSEIIQYYATSPGAPVLTIGDTTGATGSKYFDIDGLHVRYGAVQGSGFTSANTLQFGSIWMSTFRNIGVQTGGSWSSGAPNGNNGYTGVNYTGGQFFSNLTENLIVYGAYEYLLYAGNWTTGNVFNNTYLNNGGSTAAVNTYIYIQNTGDGVFNQLNCELGSTNRVINMQGDTGATINGLHMESITFTGYEPSLLYAANGNITVNGWNVVDLTVKSANITSTLAFVLFDYQPSPSTIKIRNLGILANSASIINMPLQFLYRGDSSTAGIDHGIYSIDGLRVNDNNAGSGPQIGQYAGFIEFDGHTPVSSSAFLVPYSVSSYEWGISGSTIKGAVIPVSATYTHYGQYVDATLIVPVSITSFTITLAATMGATGTQAVATGTRVHITRATGTASGTLTVKDDAGTTLTTNNTAAADYDYIFNGTHYVTFTPVN